MLGNGLNPNGGGVPTQPTPRFGYPGS
jgi:hypothetical protein